RGSRRQTSSSGYISRASTSFRNSALSSSHRRNLSGNHSAIPGGLWRRHSSGESNDEAHRFFHSRDNLLDPLLGCAAQSQRKYDQGIPRRVYSSSAILP